MTIDVNVINPDENFLEDIDEIIEDTMVQLFVLRSTNNDEFQHVKECASEHNPLYYYAPVSEIDNVDSKCLGYFVDKLEDIKTVANEVIYVEEKFLDEKFIQELIKNNSKGIILSATKDYPQLSNFYISISLENIEKLSQTSVENITMQRMVLESSYPKFGFESIFETSKKISDKNFRPDPSIVAQSTKNGLTLFGFKK